MITPRRTHVQRIFGMSVSGEERDVYVDVQRVDVILTNILSNGQMTEVSLSWGDGNTARQTTELKLTNPASPPVDPSNPDVWIPIDMIDVVVFKDREGQQINLTFNNTQVNTARRTTPTRVTHWSTNADDLLNTGATVDNSPLGDGAGGFLPSLSYKRLAGTEDILDYIDVEVCNNYTTIANLDTQLDNFNQKAVSTLENQYVVDDLSTVPGGAATPVRLDPLQSIVNVKWTQFYYLNINISVNGLNTQTCELFNLVDTTISFQRVDPQTDPSVVSAKTFNFVLKCKSGTTPRFGVQITNSMLGSGDFNSVLSCTLYNFSGHSIDGSEPVFMVQPSGSFLWQIECGGASTPDDIDLMPDGAYSFMMQSRPYLSSDPGGVKHRLVEFWPQTSMHYNLFQWRRLETDPLVTEPPLLLIGEPPLLA